MKLKIDLETKVSTVEEAKLQIKQLKEQIEKLDKNIDIKVSPKELEEGKKRLEALQKTVVEVEKSGGSFSQKFEKNLKDVTKESSKTEKSIKGVTSASRELDHSGANGFVKLSNTAKIATYDIRKTETQLDQLKMNLQQGIGQTLAFGAINGIQQVISDSVSRVKELDTIMTDVSIVSGKTREEMRLYRDYAGEAAEELGTMSSKYLEAALIYEQQGGLAAQYAKDLGESTVVAANISRESTAQMSEYLTSTINGFQMLKEYGGDAGTYITDVLAKLGAASGSDLGEIATGLSNVANIARESKFEFEEISTMIATVSEVTRAAPQKVGNAFKSIITSFTQLREAGEDELNAFTGKVEKAFQLSGINEEISLFDNGQLRDAASVMRDLGGMWEKMTNESRAIVSEAVAGKYQAETFRAFMENQERYHDLLGDAYAAEGTSAQQQLVYMDSLEAKVDRYKNAWERASSAILSEDLYGTLLEQGTRFLNLIGDQENAFASLSVAIAPIVGTLGTLFGSKFAGDFVQGRELEKLQQFRDEETKALLSQKGINEEITQEKIKQNEEARKQQDIIKNLGSDAGNAYKKMLDERENLDKKAKEFENRKNDADNAAKLYVSGDVNSTGYDTARLTAAVRNDEEIKKINAELQGLQKTRDIGVEGDRRAIASINMLGEKTKQVVTNSDKATEELKRNTEKLRESVLSITDSRHAEGLSIKDSADDMAVIERVQQNIKELDEGSLRSKKQIRKAVNELKEDYRELVAIQERYSTKELDELKASYNETSIKKKAELDRAKEQVVKKEVNKIQDERFDGVTAESIQADKTINDKMINGMEEASKKTERMQKAVKGISMGFSAVVPILASVSSYLKEGSDLSDLIATSAQSIGTSLLFSGNPWMMAAGGLATISSMLADHFGVFQSQLEKTKEGNADIIKQFLSLQESSEASLGNIQDIADSYKRFEGLKSPEGMLADPNIDEETKKEYQSMSEKIAKARPDMVKYYNDENVAILDLSQSYETLLTAQKQENIQAQGMLEKNRVSFITEYAKELDNATFKQMELTQETEAYKKAMAEARAGGDSATLTKAMEGYAKANNKLEKFNKETKATRDAINTNIINPFIQANSAVEKFVENSDITNRMKEFTSSKLDTGIISDMLSRGMSDGVDKYLANIDLILNKFGEMEKAQKGSGEEFLANIEKAGVKGQALMQQLDLSEFGDDLAGKLLEQTSNFASSRFKAMLKEEIDGGSEQDLKRIDEIKGRLSELGEIIKKNNASEGLAFNASKINEVSKEMNSLRYELDNIESTLGKVNSVSSETTETFRKMSLTPEGVKEGREELSQMYEALELLGNVRPNDVDVINTGEIERASQAMDQLKERFPELAQMVNQSGVDIDGVYEKMRVNINENVNAMFENDVDYYNKWLELNHQKVTDMTGLGKAELETYGTLANLKSEIDAMSAKEVIEIAAKVEQGKIDLAKDGMTDFTIFESQKVTIGEIFSSEYLSIWEKTYLSIGKMFQELGRGLVELVGWAAEKSGQIIDKLGFQEGEAVEKFGKGLRDKNDKSPVDDRVNEIEKNQMKREKEARDLLKKQFDEIGNSFNMASEFNLFDKRIEGLGNIGKASEKLVDQIGNAGEKKEKESKKEIKNLELVLDEYYKLENKLKDIASAYTKVNKEKSQVYGADKLKAMEEEQRLMGEQAGTNQAYLNKLRQEQNSLRSSLSGSGFRFDARGEITNLNEKLRQMEREANSLQGEAKEKAIERVKAIQEEAKRYSDVTFNMIPNKEQAIRDARATFAAIAKEKFEYKIKLRVDKDDLKNQAIEVVKEMQDTWSKLDEKNNLVGSQMKLSLGQVAMYEEELRKLQANSQGMNENDRQEKIQELQKNILNATSRARASYKELIEIQKEFIKGSLDAINKISERYQNVIDKSQLLIDKQRELYGYKAMEEVEELFNVQEKAINENIDSLVSGQRWLVAYRDTLDKNTTAWQEANDQVNEMAKKIDSQLIAKMDILKKKFETITEDIFNKFDKGFGLFGLSGAEAEFDKLISKQEEYFNGFEKATTIGGKIAEINREIEKTNDPNRARELAAFRDDELKALLAQESVSKDEYERALKLYDIKMKELAIEERRDAKRVAQLVRDSQGNMSYEYIREETADVSKDIDELQKAKNDLYEFDSNKVKEASREIFKIIADYQGKLKELQNMNLSPEEYKKQAQLLLDAAQEAINESQAKIGKWTEYMAKDGFSSLEELFKNANVDMSSLGINEDVMKGISQALSDGTLTFNQMLSGDVSKFADSLGISEEEAQKAVKSMLDFIMSENGALADALDESIKHWTESAKENVDQLGTAYDEYIKKATGVLGQYNAVTGDLNKLLKETTQASKETQDQINKQTLAMIATTKANDGASASVKQLEERMVGKNGKGGLFGSMVQLVKHQGQELQPTMIRTGYETDVLAGKTKGAGNQYNYMYQESRRAYDQTRAYNQKNLAHSYVQFDTISNKAQAVANRYVDMGKQADTARTKTINLASELANLPGWNNYGNASSGGSKTPPKGGNGAYPTGYATGGYTGTWKNSQSNREGRLALLHQKELVLNESDTKNFLQAVSITRDLTKRLSKQADQRSEVINNSSRVVNNNNSSSDVNQNIEIINNFTGETTKEVISDSMKDILSEVTTYIGKNPK